METMKIIMLALSCIAYIMVVFFAIYAYFTLREQRKQLTFVKGAVAEMTTIMMAERVQKNFEEVENIKRTLEHLVENEQYEEAERLQNFLEEAEKNAVKALKHFQEAFKDSGCKIIVAGVKKDEK